MKLSRRDQKSFKKHHCLLVTKTITYMILGKPYDSFYWCFIFSANPMTAFGVPLPGKWDRVKAAANHGC